MEYDGWMTKGPIISSRQIRFANHHDGYNWPATPTLKFGLSCIWCYVSGRKGTKHGTEYVCL